MITQLINQSTLIFDTFNFIMKHHTKLGRHRIRVKFAYTQYMSILFRP